MQIPAVRPSSELAIRAFAAADDAGRSLRRRLFHAYWVDGRDIGGRAVLGELGVVAPRDRPKTMTQWQAEWDAMDDRMVPTMRLPGGYLSRGLGVLSRLSDLLAER